MSKISIPSKHTAATLNVQFDWISQLDEGETISGYTVTCAVLSGTDAAPEDVLSGSPTIEAPVITQVVTGGTVGVIYLLTCTVTTSLGATKIMTGAMAVISSTPYTAS